MVRLQVLNTRNQSRQSIEDLAGKLEGLARSARVSARSGRPSPDTARRIVTAALQLSLETSRFLDHEIILARLDAAERQLAQLAVPKPAA